MASTPHSDRSASTLPLVGHLSPLGATLAAAGTYVAWTGLTWLLEGRVLTLLRPEAVVDRLVYTVVANLVVGTVLALLLVRAVVASDLASRSALGFHPVPRTLAAILLAGVVGGGLYVAQRPPTTDLVVVANVFAQVLPVSIAEVVVCWVLVGGSVAALLRHRGLHPSVARGSAFVVSSALFGVYHFAHSPPFNTVEMVGLLTLVSVGTGLFYFVGGSAYGALVFHNAMALFGVVSSLAAADRLGAYGRPLAPLLVTALVALVVLVGTERLFVRERAAVGRRDG